MPAAPDKDLQRMIGYNGPGTDVGFHLWPADAGGPVNMLNVIPGNGKPLPGGIKNLNNSQWARFEKRVMDLAKTPGTNVEARIIPRYLYGNSSRRPNIIETQIRVNGGEWSSKDSFRNIFMGGDGNVTH